MCCNVNDDRMASCWSLISIVLNRQWVAMCIMCQELFKCIIQLRSRERDDGDNDMLCCLAGVFFVVWSLFLGLLAEERTMPLLPIFHLTSIFS